MSPETIQKLFKPFEGSAPASSPRSEGLALGLSISQALVVQQGGEIMARSEGVGLGSEFLVKLPSAETVPRPAALATSPSTIPTDKTRECSAIEGRDRPTNDRISDAHPQTRVYDRREGLQANWQKVFAEVAQLYKSCGANAAYYFATR